MLYLFFSNCANWGLLKGKVGVVLFYQALCLAYGNLLVHVNIIERVVMRKKSCPSSRCCESIDFIWWLLSLAKASLFGGTCSGNDNVNSNGQLTSGSACLTVSLLYSVSFFLCLTHSWVYGSWGVLFQKVGSVALA